MEFQGDTSAYTGTLTGGTNGTISFSPASGTQTFNGVIAGGRPVAKNGSGFTVFTGSNTYTGGTTISAGYLTFASAAAVPATGTISANSNGSLVAAGAQSTVTGWLNSGKVNSGSTGAIAITGNSSENINFATGGYNSLGLSSTGAANYTGTITPGTNGYLFGGDSSTNLTVSTSVSTAGTPIKKVSSLGNVTLSTVNLTADTTISSAGTADINSLLKITNLISNGNKLTIGSSGAVQLVNFGKTVGNIDINNGGTLYFADGTLTSSSGGSGTITVKTGGKLEGRDFNNTAANTVQDIVLDGGTIGNATILNSNGGGAATLLKNNINVTSNGGILNGNNTGFGIYLRLAGVLSGSGTLTATGGKGVEFQGDISAYTGTMTGTAGTISFNPATGTQTFNGVIAGGRPLAKNGNGILTLANTNTYTGVTTVSAGALNLAGSLASNITVSSGAILTGYGATSGSITLNAGSYVQATTGTPVQGTNIIATAGALILPAVNATGSVTANVLRYTGTAPTPANFTISSYRSGAAVANTSGTTSLSYTSEAKTWSGSSGTWDVGTSTPWTGTLDQKFYSGDSVTFGDLAASNTVTLAGSLAPSSITVSNNTANTYTFSGTGSIVGGTSLIKSGSGTLAMTGTNANLYNGGTTINGGIVSFGTGGTSGPTSSVGALGTGAVTVNTGGTVRFWIQNNATSTYANAFTLGGGMLLSEDGNNHVSGTVTVSSSGGILETFWSGKDLWLDGALAGNGPLAVSFGGNNTTFVHLTSSNNAYSGILTINNNSTLSVENGTALQNATVNLASASATLSSSANTTLASLTGTAGKVINADATARTFTVNYNSSTPATYAGAIGDGTANGNNLALVKSGSGTLVLGGNSTYANGTTVSGGTLQLANTSPLGTGSLTISGGQLDVNGNSPTVGAVALVNGSIVSSIGGGVLSGSSFNVQNGAISPALGGGSAPLTKTGTGLVTLAGANSYGGNTTISGGTLQLLSGASLPYGGGLTANAGLFDLGGYSPTFGQLSGAAGVITDNSAGAGTTVISATGGNFNGSIQNGPAKILAVTASGLGTLTLGGTNNYTGVTSITGGALVVNGTHSGGDAYLVESGTLAGAGTISGTNTVTLNFSTTINPGPTIALGSIGTLTLPNLASPSNAFANFDLAGTTTLGGGVNDLVTVTGNLSLASSMLVTVNPTAGTLASGTGYTLFTYGTLDPASTASGSGLQLRRDCWARDKPPSSTTAAEITAPSN